MYIRIWVVIRNYRLYNSYNNNSNSYINIKSLLLLCINIAMASGKKICGHGLGILLLSKAIISVYVFTMIFQQQKTC